MGRVSFNQTSRWGCLMVSCLLCSAAASLGVSCLPAGVISQITLQSEVASFVAYLETESAATIFMWVFMPLAAVYLPMSGELCWFWKGEVSRLWERTVPCTRYCCWGYLRPYVHPIVLFGLQISLWDLTSAIKFVRPPSSALLQVL